MSQHNSTEQHAHAPSYTTYILVWLALMILTGITVAVAGIDFGKITLLTAILIASVKTYLVLTIFMHLKSENKVFRLFVGVALFFLAVSLALLFSDYSFM